MTSTASTFQTDITSLNRLINLPITPISAKWESDKVVSSQSSAPGPDDWGLVALLELSKADMLTLRTNATSAAGNGLPQYLAKPWLQKILESQFTADKSSNYYLPLATPITAAAFYKAPLSSGTVFFISDTEVLIYLQTF